MIKFAGLFVLLALVAFPAVAQDAPSQNSPSQSTSSSSQTSPEESKKEEKKAVSTAFSPKYEIAVGFAHRSFYTTGFPKVGMNGWYGSFDYNWKRWIGFEGEIQGVYDKITSPSAATEWPSIYTTLVGPQIFPFGHHKLTPFGHFLYGGAYYREGFGPYSGVDGTVKDFFSDAWEGGGGLDYHRKPRWSVRGMFDYGSTHFTSGSSSGTSGQGSYRVSVAMVYYFGER